MSLTNILQVAIGLVLTYYALGLIVNVLVTIVKDIFDMRAEALEKVLLDFFKNAKASDELYEKFKSHALILNLKPITNKPWQYKNRAERKIEKIPGGTFSLALLDAFASIAPEGSGEDPAEKIRAGIETLPEGATREALLGFVDRSEDKIKGVRTGLEGWYDDLMKNVGLWYSKNVRKWVIALALIVTLATGVDSVQVVRDLWEQPARQAAVVEVITPLVDEFGAEVIDLETLETLDEDEKEKKIGERVDDLSSIVAGLQRLEDVSITWKKVPWARENWEEKWLLKVVGLLITWGAVSQGSSFWYDIFKKLKPGSAPAPSTEGNGEAKG